MDYTNWREMMKPADFCTHFYRSEGSGLDKYCVLVERNFSYSESCPSPIQQYSAESIAH